MRWPKVISHRRKRRSKKAIIHGGGTTNVKETGWLHEGKVLMWPQVHSLGQVI